MTSIEIAGDRIERCDIPVGSKYFLTLKKDLHCYLIYSEKYGTAHAIIDRVFRLSEYEYFRKPMCDSARCHFLDVADAMKKPNGVVPMAAEPQFEAYLTSAAKWARIGKSNQKED